LWQQLISGKFQKAWREVRDVSVKDLKAFEVERLLNLIMLLDNWRRPN
jgi:hypothetical protein